MSGKAARESIQPVNYAIDQLDRRIEKEKESQRGEKDIPKDLMHYLLNNIDRKTGSRPDRSELNSRSLNIINAGADPFAGVLAAAFFYLLHNQCALRKATKEIREMFSTPSEICSGPKLNSCVYLQACIQETLRLAPPAPSHLPREVLPGDIDVYGTTFLVVWWSPFPHTQSTTTSNATPTRSNSAQNVGFPRKAPLEKVLSSLIGHFVRLA